MLGTLRMVRRKARRTLLERSGAAVAIGWNRGCRKRTFIRLRG